MKSINLSCLLTFLVLFSFSACNNTSNKNQNTNNEDSLAVFDNEKEGNWEGCMISAYVFNEDGRHLPDNFMEKVSDFESLIDHEMGSVMWYPTFADPFPMEQCNKMKEMNYIPHLTWELFWPDSVDYNSMPIEANYKIMDEVLSGKHDKYIEKFAVDAKQFRSKVLIRFLHEFNGNWYLWSGNKNGRENGGPEKVVAVWKYVVNKFRAVGADNVKWIWNPHGPSIDVSDEQWNELAKYWPGDEYVDWIGMDSYNWYPKDPWGGDRPYRSFDNCFKNLYEQCTILGDHPIMIAEFGSPEFEFENLTKKDWVSDALNKIKKNYPRIKMFVWFNINKELDWRVNSSPEVLYEFKTKLKDSYYIGKVK